MCCGLLLIHSGNSGLISVLWVSPSNYQLLVCHWIFFVVGIFVLLLEELSNPRKHAVWNILMLLEVFPFFFFFFFSFSASARS